MTYLQAPPGPYFDETPAEGAEIDFRGSVMSCVGESREAVIAVLKKDPYTLNEVWDWEKVCIFLSSYPVSYHRSSN